MNLATKYKYKLGCQQVICILEVSVLVKCFRFDTWRHFKLCGKNRRLCSA